MESKTTSQTISSAAKKLLSMMLAIAMLFSITAGIDLSAFAETSGDWEYSILDDGTAEIIEYHGSETNITIPDTIDSYKVTKIGCSAFAWCEHLTSVTIPDSVTSIDDSAFWGCFLASIIIPDSVTNIGNFAFHYCPFTSITIPSSVKNIGCGVFADCTNLESITVTADNTNYTSENGVLYNKDKSELISYPQGKINSSFLIPNSVINIENYAFSGCTSLKNITIPNSVINIGDNTFDGCESLTSMTIPNSVTSIGEFAFYECENLTSVTIGNSVTSIGDDAFDGCNSLTSITIPNSVTSIGEPDPERYAGGDYQQRSHTSP